MERLSDNAITILNELHTERLDYTSEYLPLINAINQLNAYENTGLNPEEVKDMDENAETSLLTWFVAKYGFPIGTLMDMCEAKQKGQLVILDKPMLPLVWGDNDKEIILCPNCNHDLMGGFEFADSETIMFQCPYCGQPINTKKTTEK
jgi:hypothetical protein